MGRFAISIGFSLVALLACQREPAADPAPAAKAGESPAADQTYTVRILPGEAKAGQAATSVVEVTPNPGYKMNLEFPARLKLQVPPGVTAAKSELKRDDADLTEKALRFNVAFTPAEAGKVSLTGSADFSVCNDTTCKLIRDEKLAWEVSVQ